LEYYDRFTHEGQEELDEFMELLKEKMETEYARAESLD
jgi:hypothetical protein